MSSRAAVKPQIDYLVRTDARYPAALSVLGDRAPASLALLGNVGLLGESSLALFCSVKCPGSLILKTYDLAQKLRESEQAVISGFHSPVERECLNLLLQGGGPLIICPARGLEPMRVPAEYRKPIDQGRLLLITPFSEKRRQPDAQMAELRNRLAAALANRIFIAYAPASSKTEQLAREVVSWGKPLFAFESLPTNNLMDIGAQPAPDCLVGA